MAASGKQMSLDQRTQKRNKNEDVFPFLCYDGTNMRKAIHVT